MTILHMNAEHFKKILQQEEKPVLVEFQAPWCVYCKKIEGALKDFAEEQKDKLFFGTVNIDEEPELAAEEKIELVPTFRLYWKGKALASMIAPESKAQIEDFVVDNFPWEYEKQQEAEKSLYDMIVVGGGPGGYTAALYAARSGLKTVVLEKLSPGGQMALAERIDNYPGFEDGVEGFDLALKMQKSAERFGVESRLEEVLSLDLSKEIKEVRTDRGLLLGKTVVIASGASPRELELPGEKELVGRGVNYCAACDGMFYRGKTVVVVGGGNTAAADALHLSRLCEKVILVHRRDSLRATKIYHAPLMAAVNVEFQWDSAVEEILYSEKVEGIKIRNLKSGEVKSIACDGIFVSIGRKPETGFLQGQLELDKSGYVVADETTRTAIPGVFAVGDVRTKSLRQVATAVGDGSTAVHYAEEYLAEQH